MQNVVLIVSLAVFTHIIIPCANMAAKNYVIFAAVTWESNWGRISSIGLSQKKKQTGGGWGYNFLKKNPRNFRFVTLPVEIPEKTSIHPWKFSKTLSDTPWKFQIQKPRPMEIPHQFLLEHPWKFCFFFNWPLEFPHFLSSIPLEIPCPQPWAPPCFVYFWNSPFQFISR